MSFLSKLLALNLKLTNLFFELTSTVFAINLPRDFSDFSFLLLLKDQSEESLLV